MLKEGLLNKGLDMKTIKVPILNDTYSVKLTLCINVSYSGIYNSRKLKGNIIEALNNNMPSVLFDNEDGQAFTISWRYSTQKDTSKKKEKK